jgi:MFS family permease
MSQQDTVKLAKLEKQKQREAKEITRLERELDKPGGHGYIFYLIFIICIVYITDEVATQVGTQMQMVIAQALFAPIFGYEVAVARMSLVGMVSLIAMPLAFLYKPLSDRYGRKIFLVINTLGMGIGLLLISVSTGIPVYLMGSFTVSFFIPHDIQAIYILESVPSKRRATFFAGIKAIATLGLFLIPLMRHFVMGEDISLWRGVFLIPAIIAVLVAIIALFAVRETTPFIKKRLEFLHMSDEERNAIKKDKSAEKAQGGLIQAVKFVWHHKQIKWLLLAGGFMMWGVTMTTNYETIMTYGYAGDLLADGMAFEQAHSTVLPVITQALFLFPLGSAAFQFIQGFMADKFGRKPTVIIMCIICLASFVSFYFGANSGWHPSLIGFLCGGAVGSYWAANDIAGKLMCSESTPTNLRVSVLTVQPIAILLFAIVPAILGTVIANIVGDVYLGIISIVIAVPGMLIGMLIVMFKTRETMGVDLEAITGRET